MKLFVWCTGQFSRRTCLTYCAEIRDIWETSNENGTCDKKELEDVFSFKCPNFSEQPLDMESMNFDFDDAIVQRKKNQQRDAEFS